jgi:hypothetical protein
MLILQILIECAALLAVMLLVMSQIRIQVREYRFYKSRDWDFSAESGLDRLRLDKGMWGYELPLTNWQRFHLFRPLCIVHLLLFLGLMIFALSS